MAKMVGSANDELGIETNERGIYSEQDFGLDDMDGGHDPSGGIGSPSLSSLSDFLKKRTGEGDIAEYENHILNPSNSKGIAQVLRGVTGLVGEINFAILDILFGFFRLQREGAKKHDDLHRGDFGT